MQAMRPVREFVAGFRVRAVTAHTARVAAVVAAFVVILAPSWPGRDLAALVRDLLAKRNSTVSIVTPAQIAPLRVIEPGMIFPETRVGNLLFTSRNTELCRHILFDNRTGNFADAGTIVCTEPPPEKAGDPVGQDRAVAMLRAFRK